MKASIVDLRYKMKEVLKALRRKEAVHILYHGKVMGIILPVKTSSGKKKSVTHLLFGMSKKKASQAEIEKEMAKLRGSRFHAV